MTRAHPATANDADLDRAEREFVKSMDAIQEYLQLQVKLQEQLKQGLLSLARAKYSMGPIGQAHYDADMRATTRVAVTAAAVGAAGAAAAPASPAGTGDDDCATGKEGPEHGDLE
ncbi:hypothetical protein GPECTOR_718g873 [Gonium pectorale]|uniref:Vacuolar ATPase assembly protein VMA22 n=1 Tax=Gonium pectorale TaxID=33097 RepID=A0A150FU45_GONPE|nr:hypothetical protein GPECTOR_718g873 [Gonium pectorale]|eukprot:KXZ41153.1 hypothetical protein GPECTOR_718g873 [Gonium pectorale]